MRKKSRIAQRWSDEVFYIYNIHAGLNIDQMGDRPMQISNRMNGWFLNLSCGSSFMFNHQRLRRNIRGKTIPSTLVRHKNNKHAYSLSFPHFCMLSKTLKFKSAAVFFVRKQCFFNHIQPGNNCFHLVLHLITFFVVVVVLLDAYLRCVLIWTEFNHSTVWFRHQPTSYINICHTTSAVWMEGI